MTRSRKILLALAAVVGIVVLAGGVEIPSASDLVSGAQGDRDAAAALQAQAAQADEALARQAEFTADLSAARAAVPPTPELSGLITALEAQASADGLVWVSGSPTRTPTEEGERWQLDMVVLGTPQAVAAFTGNLTRLPRLLLLDTLALSASENGTVSASLVVQFFTAPGDLDSFPEEERAAIEATLPTDPEVTS